MRISCALICSCLALLPISILAGEPENTARAFRCTATLSIDNATFIDANQVLMFVTNRGTFGRDLDKIFGSDPGTFYPYTGDTSLISHNIDGVSLRYMLFQAGMWLGGIDAATGEIRTAIAQFGTEFVPGPMAESTYLPDDPSFRVYKLYVDSLESQPNDDYLDWPVDQGAPVHEDSSLYMYGRQMLWTVFNDADPSAHSLWESSTEPMGIEVRQTVWAGDELGEDTIYYNHVLPVEHVGDSEIEVTAWVTDREAISEENEYRVVFEDTSIAYTIEDPIEGTVIDTFFYVWHLDNITTEQRLLAGQLQNSVSVEVEGLRVRVTDLEDGVGDIDLVNDTFFFSAVPPDYFISTLEGTSIYIQYELYNKGDRTINDMYFALWSDPDVGNANDDLAGCDTLNDIFFCYNADDSDANYGAAPPAIGFKYIYGPVVPSEGDTAFFGGQWLQDYRNLGLSAFMSYCCPGLSPESPQEIYAAFQGYDRMGERREYDGLTTPYWFSGDPVTGTGDLDDDPPSDRRTLASCGPFDMHPGNSQFVLIEMAVGRGTDNLNSITETKAILNRAFVPLIDTVKVPSPLQPHRYWVRQNYPNPFNPATTIQYALPERTRATVDIYNILGQKVRRLIDEIQPAGTHTVVWDGKDENDQSVSTGLYFYRVSAGEQRESKKMILLK